MITGINHITFATINITRSIEFYCNILKFKLIVKWKNGAYLSAKDIWLCLSCNTNTKTQALEEYTHIAFSVDSQSIKDIRETVVKENIPQWKENTSEGASLYILDPNYNKLEIHCGNLKTRLKYIMQQPYEEMEIYLPDDQMEL
ncbi:VOC family protein [Legionella spiritensis]|uniref:Glutathione transferase fosA (Fosfomycin resistance protein) n=1 Tax=Legionella spiritensis TaxID=452 RepID=A0A0W0YZZ9_LEGSP|nr:VOC family protein [Legionella spiritensis]KTD62163.1 Glutathione transferase fosA (Fosfomycin resistance protein) [Legionella spiritensis]SNV29464.1 Glutathione transferase fosA (Fosfomycin resistance protein) [Legionella spiritensis]